jgi:hypothetical protein
VEPGQVEVGGLVAADGLEWAELSALPLEGVAE